MLKWQETLNTTQKFDDYVLTLKELLMLCVIKVQLTSQRIQCNIYRQNILTFNIILSVTWLRKVFSIWITWKPISNCLTYSKNHWMLWNLISWKKPSAFAPCEVEHIVFTPQCTYVASSFIFGVFLEFFSFIYI